jgi:branched-chain amino acid transport system permease protein
MYALVSVGFTLIYGVIGLFNYAQSQFYMIGAYLLYFLCVDYGITSFFSILITILLVFLLGYAIERIVLQHLFRQAAGWGSSAMFATMGLGILFPNLALQLFSPLYRAPPPFVRGSLEIFGIAIAYQRLIVVVVTVAAIICCWCFIKFTKFGMAIEATGIDKSTAQLMGVNIYRVYAITFSLSAALAALSGTLLGPIYMVHPFMGEVPLQKVLITAVIGGLGSFWGAMLCGML